ncbi:MAG: type I restriction enzyme HsdR N-terminal domain-containing protein [Bacteroidales bacterium]|jgi:hypothetical protein|nr:type I restriction enzyme HsdR N-terminal domain-containing protein [Bacteroidales bacterium]
MNSPLLQLCFPEYDFRLKKADEKIYIFDEIRTKWIVCTPEEWVRQNLIKFLISELKIPQTLIALEKQIILANRHLRFDAIVYDRNIKPLILIECKAPQVNIAQKVFDQIWNYNYEISAPYFIVTNGITFVMGKCDKEKGVKFFEQTKTFEEIMIND